MPRAPRLTQDAIVAVARDVVAADGLEALSLRPLARRLDVTAPALYAHFESKDALVAAVADEELRGLVERIEAAAPADVPPVRRIRLQSRAYVDYALAHPALAQILFVFRPAWGDGAGLPELPMATKAFEVSAVAVADAVAAGAIAGDPLTASLAIWCAVHGVVTLLTARPALGRAFESNLVDTVIDAVVAGLAPAARGGRD